MGRAVYKPVFAVLLFSCAIWAAAPDPEATTRPLVITPEQRAAYLKMLSAAQSVEGRPKIMTAAADQFLGTPVEGVFNENLAEAEYPVGRHKEAEELLLKLSTDTRFQDISLAPWGYVSDADQPMAKALMTHFADSPNLVCDKVTLELLDMQTPRNWKEAWIATDRLSKRYPDGDRCADDQKFLTEFQKQFGLPATYKTLEQRNVPVNLRFSAECYRMLRRPHMQALMLQIHWLNDPQIKSELPAGAPEGAVMVLDLLREYGFLLSDAEVADYTKIGTGFLDAVPAGQWRGSTPLSEAKTLMKTASDERNGP